MTTQQSFLDNEIESGLDFIISHFDPEILYFPRTIMTKKSNGQIIAYSKAEVLQYFKESEFQDCRINAFRYSSNLERWNPDLIFIDIDRKDFKDYESFENAYFTTLKNIKEKSDGFPTVLFTGGGYHIYQPVYCKTALENVIEFNEFERPSELLLRFTKDYLSNYKADKNNNPGFKSCLVRVPNSMNSKYNTKVTIVQKWNGYRSPLTTDLLVEFRRYLIQKKIDQEKQKILLERSRNKFSGSNNDNIPWIEQLLQISIERPRRICVDLIFAPYFILIKKLSNEETTEKITEWLMKCDSLSGRRLDFDPRQKIREALKNTNKKQIGPMRYNTLKEKYKDLYLLLQDHNNNNNNNNTMIK